MTTPITPATTHRHALVNDAIARAEHLVAALRGYRAARRDGFPMSHLARIEAVLEKTTNQVLDMAEAERKELIEFGAAAEEDNRLRLANTPPPAPHVLGHHTPQNRPHLGSVVGQSGPELRRIVEPTVPVSLIDQIRTRTDCD